MGVTVCEECLPECSTLTDNDLLKEQAARIAHHDSHFLKSKVVCFRARCCEAFETNKQ